MHLQLHGVQAVYFYSYYMLTAYMDVLLTLTSFDSLSELVFTGLVDVVCQVLEVYRVI